MATTEKPVSVRMSEEMLVTLDGLAATLKRSRNWVIVELLTWGLDGAVLTEEPRSARTTAARGWDQARKNKLEESDGQGAEVGIRAVETDEAGDTAGRVQPGNQGGKKKAVRVRSTGNGKVGGEIAQATAGEPERNGQAVAAQKKIAGASPVMAESVPGMISERCGKPDHQCYPNGDGFYCLTCAKEK